MVRVQAVLAVLLLCLLASCAGPSRQPEPPPDPPVPSKYETTALQIGEFLLALQNGDGAIPDAPGSGLVNEDSNMEYALLGLAAAYRFSGDARYLSGLEGGIAWLAEREEMRDARWRGSWRYAYSSVPPYAPVPVAVGEGIRDARGVDATSALFVYLLHVHAQLSGVRAVADRYEENARAALDFLIAGNLRPDGSFASSWHKWQADGRWRLWPYCYTADQADVYLGMHSGWELYGDDRYRAAAAAVEEIARTRFFSATQERFGLGRDEDGDIELDMEDFEGIFPQGYLPWVFGGSHEDLAACMWLQGHVRSDGAISCYEGDPLYSLSAAIFAMARSALGLPPARSSLDWLIANAFDPHDGGVRDTVAAGSEKYANVAGFAIMALLDFPALLEVEAEPPQRSPALPR